MNLYALIDRLEAEHILSENEYRELIENRTQELAEYLFAKADKIRRSYYGIDVYVRGLIEVSNFCKNDCYYCGIRRSNRNAQRYRLSKADILSCCKEGYELGFRTFVMQSGEDLWYTPEKMADIIREIKTLYPECAVTLSLGEHEKETYQLWFDAGADRYLLRHETADNDHYRSLHPVEMSPEHRKQCLRDLKEIGYQVGCGFMVGSPGQNAGHLAKDMVFIQEFHPEMVGIGPFIPQHDTPYREEPAGTVELTLFMLGLIRLALPDVLLPATTALGTIDPLGREKGIKAGCNVSMPNLSPLSVRKKYMLYDNKISTGDEGAQALANFKEKMQKIGYQVVESRGDHIRSQRT